MSDIGTRMLDIGTRMSDTGTRMSDIGNRLSDIDTQMSDIYIGHSIYILDVRYSFWKYWWHFVLNGTSYKTTADISCARRKSCQYTFGITVQFRMLTRVVEEYL